MKKYIKYGLSLFLIVTLAGCKDYFDVGNNPNLVTNPNINSLLTTATSKSGINSRTFASTTTYYAQHIASPGLGSDTDTYRITDLSGTWGAAYYAMADIYDMLVMAEASNAHLHAGIAKILLAYNLSLVADTWDSAPYSEAFSRVATLTPVWDSGESLYQSIGTLLQEGLALLGRTDAAVTLTPAADLIHNGNINAWIKTGNGLLARHLNKITKKSSYDPTAVLSAIDKSYQSAADDMKMGTYNGNNPWAAVAISNAGALLGGWLSSQLIDHMNGVYYGVFDPRLPKLTDITVNNDWVGTKNGAGNKGPVANTIWDECYISINSPVTKTTAPIYIMTYEELKFVEAEAALRANQRPRAYAAYLEGIKASMRKFEVADAAMNAYLAEPSVSVGEAALTLDEIFKEKYVATYLSNETWTDARRYDYKYKGFQLPQDAALPTFIRQVAVPTREFTTNPDNAPKEQPVLSTPLWWDKP